MNGLGQCSVQLYLLLPADSTKKNTHYRVVHSFLLGSNNIDEGDLVDFININ